MSQTLSSAVQDFQRARRRAVLEQLTARVLGRSNELLSFDDVQKQLNAQISNQREELRDIPLDSIVGSVGRYKDFTRKFLPKQDATKSRWASVLTGISDFKGVPPIQVYQLGEVYFVFDGNHRVSVARQIGATHIHAYVRQVDARVPLTPDINPDDIIIKAQYTEFLERYDLDCLRNADLTVTVAGRYQLIEDEIALHRYYMGLNLKRDISEEEAVTDWYDHIYMPIVYVIRDRGILRDFPGRTETDIYVWLLENREPLQDALGWNDIDSDVMVVNLSEEQSAAPLRKLSRMSEWLSDMVTPDSIESGPAPGKWRTEWVAARKDDRIFSNILIPVRGHEEGWKGVEQAVIVAQYEGAILRGLHVVADEEAKESPAALVVRNAFDARCEAAGVRGNLAFSTGEVPRKIVSRARWADLIVFHLEYPPGAGTLAKLGSGVRQIVRRSPRPILVVSHEVTLLRTAVLAYAGTKKAREALFVATYLAENWHISLTLLTVIPEGRALDAEAIQAEAAAYLAEHGVQVEMVIATGDVASTIVAHASDKDFVIMGGYELGGMRELVRDSVVNQVLRIAQKPTLICV